MKVLVNGKPEEQISFSDRGLNYGDGLFETMVCIDGQVRFFDAHFQRLLLGCQRLSIVPPAQEVIAAEAKQLVQFSSLNPCVLKVLLSRGSGGRGYSFNPESLATRVVSIHPFPERVMGFWENGMALQVCEQHLVENPSLAGIKHLNRLEQVLASAERHNEPYDEGLMTLANGKVIEGTMSNLFWHTSGQFYTPDLTACGILGVARQKVIEALKRSGDIVEVGNFDLDHVLKADAVFMTNTTMLVAQVRSLSGKNWPLKQEIAKLREMVAYSL